MHIIYPFLTSYVSTLYKPVILQQHHQQFDSKWLFWQIKFMKLSHNFSTSDYNNLHAHAHAYTHPRTCVAKNKCEKHDEQSLLNKMINWAD